ncbi:MAG: N-acetylmuramoyl-L-alanine amidase family protein [Candidatus Saccharicenans sp.]
MPKLRRKAFIYVFSLLLFFTSVFQTPAWPKTVKAAPVLRVSVEEGADFTRLRLTSDSSLVYSHRKSGDSLIVSFRALAGLKLERQNFSSQLVKSVDLAKTPDAYLLVVKINVADFTYSHRFKKKPFEITFEIRSKSARQVKKESTATQPAENTVAPGTQAGQPAHQEKPAEESSQVAHAGSKKTRRTIVIDPGHGGMETGARGNFGALEKDITLAIALKLKEEIEKNLNYRVVMTRETDVVVPLAQRAAIANNNKADLFISIHANGSRRPNAHGSETFFLSLNATDEEARRLAYFENNENGFNDQVKGKEADDLKMILWDMAQSAYLKQSSQLAEIVQVELNELLNTANRGIKQAPFKVLTGVACPAILVEVAFITNPEEEKKLQSEDFQVKVAEAIYRGLAKFLQMYEKP